MPKGAVAPGKVWPSGPVPIIGSTKASGSGAGCSAKDWIGRRASSAAAARSEEHTSELQSLMRISYAVFCLKKKKKKNKHKKHRIRHKIRDRKHEINEPTATI